MTTKQTRGAAFRESISREFAELDGAQAVLVERVAAVLDRLEASEAIIAADGLTVSGGNGQLVAHPLIASTRQDSVALGKLLDVLLPSDKRAETQSEKAARAARARWHK